MSGTIPSDRPLSAPEKIVHRAVTQLASDLTERPRNGARAMSALDCIDRKSVVGVRTASDTTYLLWKAEGQTYVLRSTGASRNRVRVFGRVVDIAHVPESDSLRVRFKIVATHATESVTSSSIVEVKVVQKQSIGLTP